MAEYLKKTDELGKEGLLRDGVHRELIDELISITEEEAKLVIRLLTSSRI